ncbi:hypothetical protein SELMODRAFT_425755 [Selaginella moellendorffii]|uniref:SEC7 domain-containing protein n=1 Tax=Selaginella moellendorffii TaxID=88036 RepID=D8SU68_SELML|nr:hypothetical protein SELMODRAFT_425755 [Selaginella moellendorffii]
MHEGLGIQLQAFYTAGRNHIIQPEACKGIDFIVKAKKVEKIPEEVVKFLLSTIGLNRGLIGDYLVSLGDQKINRTMEKFAERYCTCNPMVKDEMSKAAFIKTNGGIDDGKDLPEEFMGGLYDRIVNKEIKMKADNVIPVTKPAGKDNNFLLGLRTS